MTEDRLQRARAALAQAEALAASGEGFVTREAARAQKAQEQKAHRQRPRRSHAEQRSDPTGDGCLQGQRAQPDTADGSPRPETCVTDPGAVSSADSAAMHDTARQIVLRQLAMAPRSRVQLERKLAGKDIPPDVAAAVLDRFTEVGLVDDEAYAQMLVRSQVATRGLARRGLAHELRSKGVDPETAQAALDALDPDDERAAARALVDKRLRTMAGLGVEVQTRRLAGMLARKGYPSAVAYAVIRDALADTQGHRRD